MSYVSRVGSNQAQESTQRSQGSQRLSLAPLAPWAIPDSGQELSLA